MSNLLTAIRATVFGGKPAAEAEDPNKKPDEAADDPANPDDEKPADAEGDPSDPADEENPTDAEGDPANPDEEEKPADARSGERRRIAAILTADAALRNPALAAHLAFATDDSADKAIATLNAAAPGGPGGLAGKMAAAKQPRLGSDSGKAAPTDRPSRLAATAHDMINRRNGAHKE